MLSTPVGKPIAHLHYFQEGVSNIQPNQQICELYIQVSNILKTKALF